jgi:hypothetical protein
MNLQILFSLLIISVFLVSCEKKVESPLENIEEEGIHFLSLHLYPSTIRMVNIADDKNFYEATKNVKKAHYLQISLDDSKKNEIYEDWKSQLDWSDWDELMSARMEGAMVSIYTPKEKSDFYFASIKAEGTVSLVWLEGEIDLNKVIGLMQNGINLGPVTDFLNDKKETEENREKMKSMRDQAQGENEEIQDSISTEESPQL